MFGERSVADGITFASRMLAAVNLDNKPFLSTNEIDDIRPDGLLADEFKPAERTRTKVAPKFSLRRRQILP